MSSPAFGGVATAQTEAEPAPQPTSAGDEIVVHDADVILHTDDGAELIDLDQVDLTTEAIRPPVYDHPYAALTSTVSVSYGSNVPSTVRTAVDAAAAQWASVLQTSAGGPIVIRFEWSDLGSGVLGYSTPGTMYTGGGLPAGAAHTPSFVNTYLNTDINGGATPEMYITLNSSRNWYRALSGAPTNSQTDLYSVALHEIGHGLGFLGSADSSGKSLSSPPYHYDHNVLHNGTPLPNVSNVGNSLRSGNLRGRISQHETFKIYSPSGYEHASTLSHFDEDTYQGSAPGSLMTPVLFNGEVQRKLDTPTIGVMAQLDWPIRVKATTPTITSATPATNSVFVTWARNFHMSGVPPASYKVDALIGSTVKASKTVKGNLISTTLSGLAANTSYTIRVTPYSPSGPGTAATLSTTTTGGATGTGSGGSGSTGSTGNSFVRNLALDGQIARLYSAYFLREPDKVGFDFWVTKRSEGMSINQISDVFASSTEFQNRYGSLSDTQFVTLVYGNVLQRGASSSEISYWVSALSGGLTRGELMVGFSDSTENIRRTSTVAPHSSREGSIWRLYSATLLRSPDNAGLTFWRDSGLSLESVANALVSSAEFTSRYSGLTDSQFVDLVYQNVLGRSPDAVGRRAWLDYLAAGASRGQLILGFSESPEYIRSTGTMP